MLHISKSIYRATWPFLDIQDPGMLFPIATPVFSLPLLFVVKSPPTTCCVLELDSVCAFSRDLESPTQTSIYDHLYINYSLPLVYLSSLKDKDSWIHEIMQPLFLHKAPHSPARTLSCILCHPPYPPWNHFLFSCLIQQPPILGPDKETNEMDSVAVLMRNKEKNRRVEGKSQW